MTPDKVVIRKDSRVFICDRKFKKFRAVDQDPVDHFKPNGLWYSCGDSWIRWCKSEMGHWLKRYLYRVRLDSSKILSIGTDTEIDRFHKRYAVQPAYHKDIPKELCNRGFFEIDWVRVAKKYSGIEINPYLFSRRHAYTWYYSWDAASGVIWRRDAIKSVDLVGIKIKGEMAYQKVTKDK